MFRFVVVCILFLYSFSNKVFLEVFVMFLMVMKGKRAKKLIYLEEGDISRSRGIGVRKLPLRN